MAKPLTFTVALGLIAFILISIPMGEFDELLFYSIWGYAMVCAIIAYLEGK